MSTERFSPYQGLVPFGEEDALFFFGREGEREVVISNLLGTRLTLLYGASGVGKSSLLRAGVAHHLKERARTQGRADEPPLRVIANLPADRIGKGFELHDSDLRVLVADARSCIAPLSVAIAKHLRCLATTGACVPMERAAKFGPLMPVGEDASRSDEALSGFLRCEEEDHARSCGEKNHAESALCGSQKNPNRATAIVMQPSIMNKTSQLFQPPSVVTPDPGAEASPPSCC